MPYRQSLVRANITIDAVTGATPKPAIVLGVADKWEGGDGDADIGTYQAARGEVVLGGPKTRDDGTATYLVDEAFWAQWPELDKGRGSRRATITITPVGDDGTAFATGGITLKGVLKTVPVPSGDFASNEGSAVAIGFKTDADRAG